MFCGKCGNSVPATAKFCANCGKPMQQEVQPWEKKKINPWKIVLIAFAALVLICVAINLIDIYVINSAKVLEGKLMGEVWASEPMESVSIDSSTRVMSAYTIEFHDDGTATRTTYVGSCDIYGRLDGEDMEVYKTEIVSWEISLDRTLTIDGRAYKCKMVVSDAEDRWYIQDGKLQLDRTYYADDKWDYVS